MLSTVLALPLMGMWLALGAPGDAAPETADGPKAAKVNEPPGLLNDLRLPGVDEKPGPAAAAKAISKDAAPPAAGADATKSEKKTSVPAVKKEVAPKASPRPQLSPEMAALRDRVRYSLDSYVRQPLNTRDFTAGDVLVACLPFGCQTEVSHEGQALNGITCLCWDYPCAGYELLTNANGHIAARVGYGLQSQPGQMLAILALSRVPSDYPMRAGRMVRNVADLVEYEKLACRAGTNQSLRLIGLAHYVPKGQTWKNALDEPWSMDRLVNDELAQPMPSAPGGGTLRLVGLSMAIARHGPAKPEPRSVTGRALEFLTEYQRYALQLQNPDGSWHPSILTARGTTNDAAGQLRASGYVVSWLAFSLPQDQLTRPEIVRAIEYLTLALGDQQARWNVGSLSKSGLDGLMLALNALSIYDLRVFRPCDPPAEEAKQPKAAASE